MHTEVPTRVLKFGGTSVETPGHILAVARRILEYQRAGDPIVVVVSAMGQTTDELIRLAHRVSRTPSRRELDMLLTSGERITMTLLAMCLESMGCPAISFTGSQSGIVTDTRHSNAQILSMKSFRIRDELERGRVVIVAGFQGVSALKEVTTLGRGGSDTTAVALAVHLGAPSCEIFTDVPGVLTADPRIVPAARPLPRIGYGEMIAFSHLGGRVLFHRAVLLARKYGIPVEVRSSLTEEPGTRIHGEPGAGIEAGTGLIAPARVHADAEEEPMESERILGVALESPVTWVRVRIPAGAAPGPATEPEAPPRFLFFSRLQLPDGSSWVEFASTGDTDTGAWARTEHWGRGSEVSVETDAALISLVGEGILAQGDIVRRSETALHGGGIPVWGVHTGTLSLSILAPAAQGEDAVRRLHAEFLE